MEEFELRQSLLHLVNGARAEELDGRLRVAGDEVASLGVDNSQELQHVVVLLWLRERIV